MHTNLKFPKSRRARALAAACVLAVPVLTACGVHAAARDEAAIAPLKESGRAFAEVAREVSPAVVYVKVEKTVEEAGPFGTSSPLAPGGQQGSGDELLRRFFSLPFGGMQAPREEHVVGQGSGFLVSSDGEIITNNHVVGDADKITVTLDDGREFPAKVVGTDPHSDVAVIRIDGKDLPSLQLADSDQVDVGEWVVAVGNPFGLSHSITAGIVSAKGRSSVGIADYEDFIQTDAAINPGNSGGPLVDLDGRVVGMNTAIYSRTGGSMGIGFAIPANMLRAISGQLVADGTVTRGYLGVVVQDLTSQLARTFGSDGAKGALVAQVEDGTPAAAAGLQRGDVVTAVDGQAVVDAGEFRNRIAMTAPGTKLHLDVMRDGKRRSLDATVGKLPDDGTAALDGRGSAHHDYGFAAQDLTPDLAAQLGLNGQRGVVVAGVVPGSTAEAAGLRAGDLILEANRQAVATTGDLAKALAPLGKDDALLLLVQQGRFTHYLVLGGE